MSLLEMSFYGAVMILVIVIIRALILHRLPKKFFLILWGIALFRLLVPFEISSGLSIYSHVPDELSHRLTPVQESTDFTSDSANVQTHEILISGNNTNYPYTGIAVLPGNAPETPSNSSNVTTTPVSPVSPNTETASVVSIAEPSKALAISSLTIVRVTGTLLLALFFLIAYFKCYTEFQTSLPVKEDYVKSWLALHPLKRMVSIRQSDKITAPLTYGVLRPVILLPKNTNWEDKKQLDYILYHEYTHIRRFDLVTKLLMIVALCLHWFNPLVWVMYLLFNRDIELACDECVVKHSAGQEKTAYALTLINMEEKKLYFAPLCNNFSKNAIEERITAIMKLKKTTLGAILVSIILIIIVIATLMTSAKETGGSGDVSPTPFPTVTATPIPTPGSSLNKTDSSAALPTPKTDSAEELQGTNDFPKRGVSTPSYLNVRKGAGYDYAIITKIPCTTIVRILGVSQAANGEYWYEVSLTINGEKQSGYINSQYVNIVEDGILSNETPEDLLASASFPRNGSVTPRKLNVREGAGYNYPILTQIENNTRVNVLAIEESEEDEFWYYVSFSQSGEALEGYVNSQYIRITDGSYPDGIVQTQTSTEEIDSFFTFTDADFPRGGFVSEKNVRVRKGPGYDYAIMSYINPSTSVEIQAQETAKDGALWYKISYFQSNTLHIGYVDAQYIWVDALSPEELQNRISPTKPDNSFPIVAATDFIITDKNWNLAKYGDVLSLPTYSELEAAGARITPGDWYQVALDEIIYFFPEYAVSENDRATHLALCWPNHKLSGGAYAGMLVEDLLKLYPNLAKTSLNNEDTAFIESYSSFFAFRNDQFPEIFLDHFDYALVALIQSKSDALPVCVAFLIQDEFVNTITTYLPTAD